MRVYPVLVIGAITLAGLFTPAPAAAQSNDIWWLPLCGKCPRPRIFSKSGIGTAHAAVEARLTYTDVKQNCEGYAMSPNTDCDKEAKEMLKDEAGKIYRASADCIHGKVTDIFGDTYTYAGVWSSGLGKGRSRWRDAKGKIVSTDGEYSGLSISTIGEALCPKGFGMSASRQGRHH